ncbi:glycosylase [Gemmatimonadota bacterium]
MVKILSENSLPNIPWQDRPDGCDEVIWRWSENPVIDRNPIPRSPRIYNSAVVPYQGKFVGVFRADQRGQSIVQLHFGRSDDGLEWRIEPEPIPFVDESGKPVPPDYAYDPRVVKIEDTYYITWCAEYHGPTIGIARTKDFRTFVRLENAYLPFNRNGVLFPRRFDGKFLMLNRPSDNGHTPFGDIFISESPDMCYWGRHRHVMAAGGGGYWESTKIGAGPVPIETDAGWLLLYHGVVNTCNGYVYSMGGAILDRDDPAKVLSRSPSYLLIPETDYECVGFVPNVLFPCASLCDADTGRLAIYYGAADTYTAMAFGYLDEIIEFVRKNSR